MCIVIHMIRTYVMIRMFVCILRIHTYVHVRTYVCTCTYVRTYVCNGEVGIYVMVTHAGN